MSGSQVPNAIGNYLHVFDPNEMSEAESEEPGGEEASHEDEWVPNHPTKWTYALYDSDEWSETESDEPNAEEVSHEDDWVPIYPKLWTATPSDSDECSEAESEESEGEEMSYTWVPMSGSQTTQLCEQTHLMTPMSGEKPKAKSQQERRYPTLKSVILRGNWMNKQQSDESEEEPTPEPFEYVKENED
ncbi:Hypothetical predicted protein [Cloeon dipterum]|uniref:Uncharacterized protein n=1 Tax=Cloeon dipterum TaxID=197152 RepID=A0A8S1D6I0_9INSE|nr:Hypothetical predicted protein [Cloeon dipterum]